MKTIVISVTFYLVALVTFVKADSTKEIEWVRILAQQLIADANIDLHVTLQYGALSGPDEIMSRKLLITMVYLGELKKLDLEEGLLKSRDNVARNIAIALKMKVIPGIADSYASVSILSPLVRPGESEAIVFTISQLIENELKNISKEEYNQRVAKIKEIIEKSNNLSIGLPPKN